MYQGVPWGYPGVPQEGSPGVPQGYLCTSEYYKGTTGVLRGYHKVPHGYPKHDKKKKKIVESTPPMAPP